MNKKQSPVVFTCGAATISFAASEAQATSIDKTVASAKTIAEKLAARNKRTVAPLAHA